MHPSRMVSDTSSISDPIEDPSEDVQQGDEEAVKDVQCSPEDSSADELPEEDEVEVELAEWCARSLRWIFPSEQLTEDEAAERAPPRETQASTRDDCDVRRCARAREMKGAARGDGRARRNGRQQLRHSENDPLAPRQLRRSRDDNIDDGNDHSPCQWSMTLATSIRSSGAWEHVAAARSFKDPDGAGAAASCVCATAHTRHSSWRDACPQR